MKTRNPVSMIRSAFIRFKNRIFYCACIIQKIILQPPMLYANRFAQENNFMTIQGIKNLIFNKILININLT